MGKNIGFKGPDRVSISTLVGRVIVPYVMGKYQAQRFGWSKGQCDLVLRKDGKWFLLETVDVPEATKTPATDFIGVDLGVENIATDSDGNRKSSKDIEAKRIKYARRRKTLGKATKDAGRNKRRRCRRALKRTRDKEARYRRDINHQISKDLVASAKGTDRGIALEDLEGIRERTAVHRQQRDRFNGWAHAQLGGFIVYKAQLAGVAVEFLDPAYTSQTCHACGHCERGNRKSQAEFVCKACGHTEHADVNAARNIRARAVRQAAHRDGKGRSRDDCLMPSTVAMPGFSRGVLDEVIPTGRAGRYTILVIVPDAGRPSRLALVPRPCRRSESNSAMKIIDINEAAVHLSKLVERALEGEVIIIARAGRPAVRLMPIRESDTPRQGGQWKGKVRIAEDFDELPDDFTRAFGAEPPGPDRYLMPACP